MATPWRDPRTGILCIRVAIPAPLKTFFKEHHGKAHEWKKQLVDPDTGEKARSEIQAKRLWPDYWSEWTTAKEAAEAEVYGTEFRLTDRQADALCGDWLASKLAEHGDDVPDEFQRELNMDMFINVLEVNGHRDKPSYVHLRRHFERNSYLPDEAAKLLLIHKMPLPVGSEAFLAFCERLAKTGIQLVRILDDRADGDWRAPDAVSNAPTVGLIGSGKGETINQVYQALKEERKLNERQLMEYNKPINDLITLVGDQPVTRITASHIRSYKEDLIKQGLAATTVNGRLSVLRRLFKYAKDNAMLSSSNPAGDIGNIKVTKQNSKDRVNWTNDELQRLLSGPVHAEMKRPKGGRGEASFWLPLLCLFAGARLAEMAQLRIEDIQESRDGIAYVAINDEHGKRVKNKNSVRKVPLHKQLLEWGFQEYVASVRESGEELLFLGVDAYKGQVAKAWGQWCGRYRRDDLKVISKDVLKDFHSLRHNFIDACKEVPINDDLWRKITGHAPQDVGGGYGSSHLLKTLKLEIDKVVYEEVDLSMVKSKWAKT